MADQQADSVLVVEDSPRTRSRNRYLTCSASIVLMLAGAAINQFSELPGGNIVFFLGIFLLIQAIFTPKNLNGPVIRVDSKRLHFGDRVVAVTEVLRIVGECRRDQVRLTIQLEGAKALKLGYRVGLEQVVDAILKANPTVEVHWV